MATSGINRYNVTLELKHVIYTNDSSRVRNCVRLMMSLCRSNPPTLDFIIIIVFSLIALEVCRPNKVLASKVLEPANAG